MDYQQLIDSMTPEVYRNLQRAIELGKWPDGRPLSHQQREDVMQAIIVWGQSHLSEQDRIGYIDKGHKAGDSCEEPEEAPLAWNN